jgi:CysZ protein
MATPRNAVDITHSVGDLWRGFALPFSAVRRIRQTPRLRRLAGVCAVVTAVALVAVIVFVSKFADDALSLLWARPDNGWRVLWDIVRFLTTVVGVVVGANAVPLLLLAPLQDPLSEATEVSLGAATAQTSGALGLVRQTAVSVAHTLQRIALLLGGHLLLLLLHLIPGPGSVLWTILATLWTAAWLAAEYLDIPMARHLYRFSEVRRVLREHLPLSVGFGLGLYVLLWVPLLNLFLVPVAVVAGTQLFCSLRERGTLSPPRNG